MTKEMLLKVAAAMPDEFHLDELFERLIFAQKVEDGLKSLEEEGGIPHDVVEEQMKTYINRHQDGKRGMVA